MNDSLVVEFVEMNIKGSSKLFGSDLNLKLFHHSKISEQTIDCIHKSSSDMLTRSCSTTSASLDKRELIFTFCNSFFSI